MGGYIMQLQNFSVNDGEGIRTVIFMAGCPLSCAWCSNPEGQTQNNPLVHWVETEEVVKKIHSQAIFYRFSGGGVTFSGGEATSQPQFLKELTDIFYDDGYNLAIETCGVFNFDLLEPTLKKMNLIFMDLKHIDPEKHKLFTGIDNSLILENIIKTSKLGVEMVVRVPVIIGVNGDDHTIKSIFEFLKENAPNVKIELLPYHKFGEEKYIELEMELPDKNFEIPDAQQMKHWREMAMGEGLQIVSYL